GGGPLQFAIDTARLAIYENGARLEVQDGTTDRATSIRLCTAVHGSRAFLACDRAVYAPYVELDRGTSHTLRVVMNGREVTTTMSAGMHWQWIWANGVWLAAAPIGWAADLASGRMKYFGRLRLDHLFPEAAAAAASN